MRFLFLGTGASSGVPVIACKCDVCMSSNLKNKRLRTSGLLQANGKNFLLDASPDIRYLSLKYQISHLDGLFLTHPHEDHIGGLNDLRPYFFIYKNKLPLFLSDSTYEVLKYRFSYLLDRFAPNIVTDKRGEISLNGLNGRYFTYSQEGVFVNGFRFGNFAYVTDIKDYDLSLFEDLEGVETLVLGAINEAHSKMHFTIKEALEFKKKITSVKRCYLTHLSHEVDHESLSKSLPEGVLLSYDGLIIDV
ncbi:MAG: MBL fold metallo-hydrolase [Chlamydiae bacterium]|nr:MBL fold metallo-hydrolase [Chlamydiota bacterium]